MAFILRTRVSSFRPIPTLLSLSQFSSSRASKFLDDDQAYSVSNRLHLSPLFPRNGPDCIKDCKIEVMDDETWHVSSVLSDSWRGNLKQNASKMKSIFNDKENDGNEAIDFVASNKEDPDFDEIEDMRIRGKLFYKLDKDSKEYEEHKFDYHRRKSPKNVKNRKEKEIKKKEIPSTPKVEKASKKEELREIKKNKQIKSEPSLKDFNYENLISQLHEKKQRAPTFNQITAPYHEPFCLDIYISKGSVRASIIHRVTSNVVAVSHSISKDMKFDLGSTKNRSACAAVGEVLAQRALADDIHNVVYTPRKGEKLEGKLQIVLKSIIDGGVSVKVKLKQRKLRKGGGFPPRNQDQKLPVKYESRSSLDLNMAGKYST